MAAKRPERRDTGEWAKHLRPKRKRMAWKADRRVAKKKLSGMTHYGDNKGRDEYGI